MSTSNGAFHSGRGRGSTELAEVRGRRPSSDRGITLIELIVVITIVSALLGMSVAGYVAFGRGMKITGLRNRVQTVVRQARNSTLYEGAPARVFMEEGDSETVIAELRNPAERFLGRVIVAREDRIAFEVEGRAKPVEFHPSRLVGFSRRKLIRAVGFRTVGQWHLERSDLTAGYLGRGCRVEHGETAPGRIGGGVHLGVASKGQGRITALAAPDDAFDPYTLPDGGRIELWVKATPEALERQSYLVSRRGSYALRLSGGGVLEAGVPGATTRAADYRLPANRWVKLVMEFSPAYVRLYAEEVERGSVPGADLSAAKKQKLVFGLGFAGTIDEIRVQRRVVSEEVAIPRRYEVTGPAALFFTRGRLDPRKHAGPVRYEVRREGKVTGFTVTLGGIIEPD